MDDYSCTDEGIRAVIWNFFGGFSDIEGVCYAGAKDADAWIRQGAKERGLPINI